MNKIAIPAILVATVLVAAFVLIQPVQQATTVHTTILGKIQFTKVTATGGGGTAAASKTITITAGTGGPITVHEVALTTSTLSTADTLTVQLTSIDGKTVTHPTTPVIVTPSSTTAKNIEAITALGYTITISTAGNTAVITIAEGESLTASTFTLASALVTVSGPGAVGATAVMS